MTNTNIGLEGMLYQLEEVMHNVRKSKTLSKATDSNILILDHLSVAIDELAKVARLTRIAHNEKVNQ